MEKSAFQLPAPVEKAVQILERQRAIAREVLGKDPPGCVHHPEEGKMLENIQRLIAALERAGAEWVLVGAEAVNLYSEPRATEDFDLVVAAGRFDRALKEVEREFGGPQLINLGPATRFPSLGFDLIRSDAHALFQASLDSARPGGSLRVPSPETVIALKFLSAISGWRRMEDRKQDALDLIRVYRTQEPDLDRAELMRLGGLAYRGGEKELKELLDKIDRGEEITL